MMTIDDTRDFRLCQINFGTRLTNVMFQQHHDKHKICKFSNSLAISKRIHNRSRIIKIKLEKKTKQKCRMKMNYQLCNKPSKKMPRTNFNFILKVFLKFSYKSVVVCERYGYSFHFWKMLKEIL